MNPDTALSREWLETNGLGGFASSTLAGLNTRRYHGLLTAATKPPVGRVVLLSKLEETAIVGEERFDLSTNRYPGTTHPRGFEVLCSFDNDPFPTFTWIVEGITIRKTVFMVHGENKTVIQYDVDGPARLELRPLIAFRDYHTLTRANNALDPAVGQADGCVMLRPYLDLPVLYLAHNAVRVDVSGHWYYNLEYDVEHERGLDFQEDLFNPCVLCFDGSATVVASIDSCHVSSASALRDAELRRRAEVSARAPVETPLVRRLVRAADQYIVQRGDFSTVVAGYHWFTDWGRDTMIALPGLTLVTGRFSTARSILLAFAEAIDQGMLPNRFPDSGETAEYNTVDATLWFFEAIRAYVEYSGDLAFATETLYSKLIDIIEWHLRGTRHGILCDSDGLLRCGVAGSQLTWMDAKIGDWVVTPRLGKPVEVQALWYNALRIMQHFASTRNDGPRHLFLKELADHARESFNQLFWNETTACLYDCLDGDRRDGAIRPNQIFAVSLHSPLIEGERARKVVESMSAHLLTPWGLRSLAPSEPGYRARYDGGVLERDSAYHQGTVWPWLIGPFITAFVKVNEGSPEARQQAAKWLAAMEQHLDAVCIGHIAEITDADAPHNPRGCVAQAWSIAEVLRAAVEDVHGYKPAMHLTAASALAGADL